MLRVKVSSGSHDPILRQTPGRLGVWDDVQFYTGDYAAGPFDCWIVFDSLARDTRALCSSGRVVFVPWEPPSIRAYHPRFLEQFSAVITFRDDIKHRNRIQSHPLLPWWIGTSGGHQGKKVVRDYDALKAVSFQNKERAVSVVCSDKTITEDHRRRLHFIHALKERLGEQLQVFGPGFREWPEKWPDKWDQIAPFQYHLALENSAHRDYWTEKVADAFLGGAFLLYWGCPNLREYFPNNSFHEVNRDDPKAAAASVAKLLDGNHYEMAKPAIANARNLVLDRYNLFAELSKYVKCNAGGAACNIHLRDESFFCRTPLQRAKSAVRWLIRGDAC